MWSESDRKEFLDYCSDRDVTWCGSTSYPFFYKFKRRFLSTKKVSIGEVSTFMCAGLMSDITIIYTKHKSWSNGCEDFDQCADRFIAMDKRIQNLDEFGNRIEGASDIKENTETVNSKLEKFLSE